MNIFMIIFFLFEAVIGLASSLYILVSLFVTIGYKIYRKCKFGISYITKKAVIVQQHL